MVYFKNEEILIRDLEPRDAQILTDEENAQGWHQTIEKYETRLRDQAEKQAATLVAEYCGNVAGYINVYYRCKYGPFAEKGYPVIVDFGVLIKYRRRGIGSKLMDVAEQIAAEYADTVCLSVGLHSGYGSAQRMYVKRGYLPDGSGAWYGRSPCPEYAECRNDDDLVWHFSKKLR